MADNLNDNDLAVAKTLGEHTAMLAAIEKNTRGLPELATDVAKHNTYFTVFFWLGGGVLTGMGTLFVDWFQKHVLGK